MLRSHVKEKGYSNIIHLRTHLKSKDKQIKSQTLQIKKDNNNNHRRAEKKTKTQPDNTNTTLTHTQKYTPNRVKT